MPPSPPSCTPTWTSHPHYTALTLSYGEGYYFSPSSGKLLGGYTPQMLDLAVMSSTGLTRLPAPRHCYTQLLVACAFEATVPAYPPAHPTGTQAGPSLPLQRPQLILQEVLHLHPKPQLLSKDIVTRPEIKTVNVENRDHSSSYPAQTHTRWRRTWRIGSPATLCSG